MHLRVEQFLYSLAKLQFFYSRSTRSIALPIIRKFFRIEFYTFNILISDILFPPHRGNFENFSFKKIYLFAIEFNIEFDTYLYARLQLSSLCVLFLCKRSFLVEIFVFPSIINCRCTGAKCKVLERIVSHRNGHGIVGPIVVGVRVRDPFPGKGERLCSLIPR